MCLIIPYTSQWEFEFYIFIISPFSTIAASTSIIASRPCIDSSCHCLSLIYIFSSIMGPDYNCMVDQAIPHIEFRSILKKHRLQKTHYAYHPTPRFIQPSSFSVMPRHVSLPEIYPESTMFSRDRFMTSGGCGMKRTSSINSMRRSVKGMKNLLPLKLTSTSRQGQEWLSPTSSHRSTFGLPVCRSQSILERRANHSFAPPPMTIRPEQYRDTPIYTEAGSPMMGRAYYTDYEVCFSCSPPGSSCGDESFLFHEDESSSDEGYVCGDWLKSVPENFVAGGSRTSTVETCARDSDLSFKCQGELTPLGTQLFRDEAAWLSSSSPPQPRYNPSIHTSENARVPVRDAETWLDDASSYDGDDDDILVSTSPSSFVLSLS